MTAQIKPMDYEEFFDEIIKNNENIRFTGIFDGKLHGKFKEGIQGFFTEEESKSSLSEAQNRWAFRKNMSYKIGAAKFAMAQYEKVNRITIPFGKEGIILVTAELDTNVNEIVDQVLESRNKFFG